jgi:hypothetical protein
VCDESVKGPQLGASVCTEEVSAAADENCATFSSTDWGVSTSTAWKLCRDAAEAAIVGSGTARCCAPALLQDSPGVLSVTWFSDEAHFHFDGHINKQNVRLGASENPGLGVAGPLHPESYREACATELRSSWWHGHLSLLSDRFVPSAGSERKQNRVHIFDIMT